MSEEKKESKPKKAAKPDAEGADAKTAKAAKGEKKAKKGDGVPEGATASGQSDSTRAKAIKLAAGEKYVPRARKRYDDVVRKALQEQFKYANPMQVPRLDKIVINMGVGETTADTKKIQSAVRDLTLIAGQKPVITKARIAISNFKLRENMPIGAKVTLRKERMYEFLDRLVTVALPRVRDFRGLSSTAFDGHGNYSLGLSEQMVFPEINPDKFTRPQGMNITLVTSAKTDDEARQFLRAMGVPLKKDDNGEAAA